MSYKELSREVFLSSRIVIKAQVGGISSTNKIKDIKKRILDLINDCCFLELDEYLFEFKEEIYYLNPKEINEIIDASFFYALIDASTEFYVSCLDQSIFDILLITIHDLNEENLIKFEKEDFFFYIVSQIQPSVSSPLEVLANFCLLSEKSRDIILSIIQISDIFDLINASDTQHYLESLFSFLTSICYFNLPFELVEPIFLFMIDCFNYEKYQYCADYIYRGLLFCLSHEFVDLVIPDSILVNMKDSIINRHNMDAFFLFLSLIAHSCNNSNIQFLFECMLNDDKIYKHGCSFIHKLISNDQGFINQIIDCQVVELMLDSMLNGTMRKKVVTLNLLMDLMVSLNNDMVFSTVIQQSLSLLDSADDEILKSVFAIILRYIQFNSITSEEKSSISAQLSLIPVESAFFNKACIIINMLKE